MLFSVVSAFQLAGPPALVHVVRTLNNQSAERNLRNPYSRRDSSIFKHAQNVVIKIDLCLRSLCCGARVSELAMQRCVSRICFGAARLRAPKFGTIYSIGAE
jgi:hypothetical protein